MKAERSIDLDRKLAAEKQASTEDVEDISQTESRLAVVVQDLAEGIENVSMSADRGRRMVSGVGLKVDVDMDDGSSGVCSGKEVSHVLLYTYSNLDSQDSRFGLESTRKTSLHSKKDQLSSRG